MTEKSTHAKVFDFTVGKNMEHILLIAALGFLILKTDEQQYVKFRNYILKRQQRLRKFPSLTFSLRKTKDKVKRIRSNSANIDNISLPQTKVSKLENFLEEVQRLRQQGQLCSWVEDHQVITTVIDGVMILSGENSMCDLSEKKLSLLQELGHIMALKMVHKSYYSFFVIEFKNSCILDFEDTDDMKLYEIEYHLQSKHVIFSTKARRLQVEGKNVSDVMENDSSLDEIREAESIDGDIRPSFQNAVSQGSIDQSQQLSKFSKGQNSNHFNEKFSTLHKNSIKKSKPTSHFGITRRHSMNEHQDKVVEEESFDESEVIEGTRSDNTDSVDESEIIDRQDSEKEESMDESQIMDRQASQKEESIDQSQIMEKSVSEVEKSVDESEIMERQASQTDSYIENRDTIKRVRSQQEQPMKQQKNPENQSIQQISQDQEQITTPFDLQKEEQQLQYELFFHEGQKFQKISSLLEKSILEQREQIKLNSQFIEKSISSKKRCYSKVDNICQATSISTLEEGEQAHLAADEKYFEAPSLGNRAKWMGWHYSPQRRLVDLRKYDDAYPQECSDKKQDDKIFARKIHIMENAQPFDVVDAFEADLTTARRCGSKPTFNWVASQQESEEFAFHSN